MESGLQLAKSRKTTARMGLTSYGRSSPRQRHHRDPAGNVGQNTASSGTGSPGRAVAPSLVIFSADQELSGLVQKIAAAPWKIERCEDPAIGREVLSRPNVRLVVVDDATVDEEARGWLLDRIRRFVPQALLIYIASTHSPNDEMRARRYSAQYYTAKPLDLDRTARVIQAFIRTATERDQIAEARQAPARRSR
jgi:DNA-binding NtrC family response regulator